jgi:hypothetical protein
MGDSVLYPAVVWGDFRYHLFDQFFVSLMIDSRYDRGRMLRNYFWVIWYPLFFWLLTMMTPVVAS